MNKQITLAVITVLVTILFFRIETNRKWINDKIMPFKDGIYDELDSMSLEDRKFIRWQGAYSSTVELSRFMDSARFKKSLILIPPQKYFNDNHLPVIMPEPIVFYYFSGLKTILPTSKHLYKAGWGLFITQDREMTLHEIVNRYDIDTLLNAYKRIY